MVSADARTAHAVDLEFTQIACFCGAFDHLTDVRKHVAGPLLYVVDAEARLSGKEDLALVACLAAALGIKGRLIEDQFGFFALGDLVDARASDQRRHETARRLLELIALEAGRSRRIAHGEPDFAGALLARAFPAFLAARALLVHQRVEAGFVDADLAGAENILREVERETERVVELEGDIAGKLAALLQARGCFLQQRKAAAQRALETRLFLLQCA